jgi:hypothetical protein
MNLWAIFRWPLAIAVLSLTGLITGLVSDTWGDALAAIGLGIPTLISLWALFARPRRH